MFPIWAGAAEGLTRTLQCGAGPSHLSNGPRIQHPGSRTSHREHTRMSSPNDTQKHPPDSDVATVATVDSGLEADAGPANVQATEAEVEDDIDSIIEVDVGALACLCVPSHVSSMPVILVTATGVSAA